MLKDKSKTGFPCPCCGQYVVSLRPVVVRGTVREICGDCHLEHTGRFFGSPFKREGNMLRLCPKGHELAQPSLPFSWHHHCDECEQHPSLVDHHFGTE